MTLDDAIHDLIETMFPHKQMVRVRALESAINDDGTVNASALRTTLIIPIPPFEIAGALAVGTDVAQARRVPQNGTLRLVEARVRTAPTGSEATFALEVDGSVAATVSIANGSTYGSSSVAIAVTAGQTLTLNATSVGSTTPAESATVAVTFTPS